MSGARKATGAVVLLGVLAVAACTPGPPEPSPPPTPTPTPSASQSPSETPQERQERLDYAAAEKSYRTFRAEYNRVLRAGGAKEPTKVMKATAGGEYLATFTRVIRSYENVGSRNAGTERITYVRPSGYTADLISLDVCEDGSKSKTLLPSGSFRRGELRTAALEVRKIQNHWKVWSGSGKRVGACD